MLQSALSFKIMLPECEMIISSRQNPSKGHLRRTSTPNKLRLIQSLNGLLALLVDSPLLSPVLPSIIPHCGKKSRYWIHKVIRLLVWLACSVCLLQLIQLFSDHAVIKNKVGSWPGDGKIYQFIAIDILPAHTTPIVGVQRLDPVPSIVFSPRRRR